VLSCISIPDEPVDGEQLSDDPLAWSSLVQAMTAHAQGQPDDSKRELLQWADLVAGMAELQDRAKD
jgi:hypothetical protein